MTSTRFDRGRRAALCLSGLALVGATLYGVLPAGAQEAMVVLPGPALDERRPDATTETAVLAGGCFWGVQAVYQHVKGVSRAVSGYAGGPRDKASYDMVTSGRTGHAEAVEVTFDPRIVSYGQILQIFFSVAHNPTQLNRQGPDVGTQYRSALFFADPGQRRIAEAYIAQLDQARVFPKKIVTQLNDATPFFAAEGYHQDYATLNPNSPYILRHDLPKIEGLKRLFPAAWRADPVLLRVSGGRVGQ
ncbi:peptide-methionine (S)-S-oxide reductase MsrA [Reyranella sp.]|uniref:peptide-methionine (S)-S-oxide reductase MsrA n=1 Tax=Reyranella sp. TaxID=1929291 RepID=UPI003BA8A408